MYVTVRSTYRREISLYPDVKYSLNRINTLMIIIKDFEFPALHWNGRRIFSVTDRTITDSERIR